MIFWLFFQLDCPSVVQGSDVTAVCAFSLKRNPVTFSFVAALLGIYLVLLFTALRLDRRDVISGRVIELIDNNEKHSQSYVLEFETGMRSSAGTTAKVSDGGHAYIGQIHFRPKTTAKNTNV